MVSVMWLVSFMLIVGVWLVVFLVLRWCVVKMGNIDFVLMLVYLVCLVDIF